VLQVIDRNRELAAAREELAQLAVADERNRFARDLHDILGHSLTVVAVKAELAGRLVRTDPVRAEEEIASVEALARQALADVRSAVSGFRDVTLAGELAGARAALDAAGIDADLPNAIDDVPRIVGSSSAGPSGRASPTSSATVERPGAGCGSPPARWRSPTTGADPPSPRPGPVTGSSDCGSGPRPRVGRSPSAAPPWVVSRCW